MSQRARPVILTYSHTLQDIVASYYPETRTFVMEWGRIHVSWDKGWVGPGESFKWTNEDQHPWETYPLNVGWLRWPEESVRSVQILSIPPDPFHLVDFG
jgi:hypothetical protein